MDLFVVKRFVGDENNSNVKEDNKLNKILKKVSKRKKENVNKSIKTSRNDDINIINIESSNKLNDKENDDENENENEEPRPKRKKVDLSNLEGFTVLGTNKFESNRVVKRVLPNWLQNPSLFSLDLSLKSKLSNIAINKKVESNLKEKNIKYLFPVQAEFIPWQLKTMKNLDVIQLQDACVSAPTGSGKSLAFVIPTLQYLLEKLEKRCLTIKAIRTLVILPTYSLALQIYNIFSYYCTGTNLKVGLISAGQTFKSEQKMLVTKNSVWGTSSNIDILVCTAGRLVDHIKYTEGFNLKNLQFVIIDEADRVLDSIQDDWLYHLENHLQNCGNQMSRNVLNLISVKTRKDPQKLLFSATLSQDPEKLQRLSLFQPKLFTCITEESDRNTKEFNRFIGKYTTPKELTEKYIICKSDLKPLILYKFILETVKKDKYSKIIVFTSTTDTVHRLSSLLCFMAKDMYKVAQITAGKEGNMKNKEEVLKLFEAEDTNVLICTDFMTRGIDFSNINCVVSYTLPCHLKTYIHRAGRTARAGMEGLCVTMLGNHQVKEFKRMLWHCAKEIEKIERIEYDESEINSLVPLYKRSLSSLKFKVRIVKSKVVDKKKKKKQIFITKK